MSCHDFAELIRLDSFTQTDIHPLALRELGLSDDLLRLTPTHTIRNLAALVSNKKSPRPFPMTLGSVLNDSGLSAMYRRLEQRRTI